MERRKFTIGLGALATGSAAAMGTSAFSFVRADRDITVDVVDDEDAYLGLEATSEYARQDGDTLELHFAGGAGDGSELDQNGDGLNENADSRFDDVFKLTNSGTQDARISFQNGDGIDSFPDEVVWYHSDTPGWEDNEISDNPVIGPGDSLYIHVIFFLRDEEADSSVLDEIDTLGIVAEEP